MLILTIDLAGAFQPRPERMGMVKDSTRTLLAFWIERYSAWSTANGDPAVGRYAGCGGGIGFLALLRSSSEG